uniref:Mucin n=1 Tax=Rhipicephalus appendiculatus TaxID=34631 RepID=A0A131YV89_RHIAP
MDISTVLAALWGVLMLLHEPCRGVPQGDNAPPPLVFVPGSLPPWEASTGSHQQAPTYEAPHTSPVFVRAEPIPLSEPQGTGWRPMHNPASWLSQPHPDNPPISTGPSSYVFPGNRPPPPPITAPPSFPQVPQSPTAHPDWGSSIPSTPQYTVPPQTNTLPQLSNEIPPERTSPPTMPGENTVPHPISATDPATERLPDTTQATPATDATVSLSVNTVSDGRNNVHQQSNATPSSTSSDSSPFRVSGGVIDQSSVHRGSVATVDAEVGGSVTVTPNETSTPATVDKDPPNIESPDYPLAGGAVAGIVIGSIASVALLAGLITYIVLRRPFLKLLNGQDKSSTDNVAYIDDSVRSSYMNTHIELPKESSEEMTSLDNDSFLNSLEAVTIQNYWADTSKNTNV